MSHRNNHRIVCAFPIILIICILLLAQAAYASELLLPDGLKRIEEQAFFGDTSLDSVVVQEGTEVIGSGAFAQSSVKSVSLPTSLYFIADNAFDGCENLTVNAQEGTYAYSWAVKNRYIQIEEGAEGEETKVVVPETLRAGMDLTVQLFGPADTIHHSVYLTNELTGEYQCLDLTKATATATIDGYFFEPDNTYRLTVYTVTRQYQTLTPVTKTIRIIGKKPEAPVLDLPDTMKINQYNWYKTGIDGDVRSICEYYTMDEELVYSSDDIVCSGGGIDLITWYFNGYSDGGRIRIRYTASQNGIWSEWAYHTITVVPVLYTVNVNDCPDSIENGLDFGFSFEYEGYADICEWSIKPENSDISDAYGECWLGNDSGSGAVHVSAQDIQPGKHIIYMCFRNENAGTYVLVYQKAINVTAEERDNAPTVTVTQKEVYLESDIDFTIDTSEAERLAIKKIDPCGNTESHTQRTQYRMTSWTNWIYEQGTYLYSFAVRRDGRWSAWSDPIEVLAKEKAKLASPSIHVNTPMNAGEDIIFTFDDVENATDYSVSLQDGYNNSSLYKLDPATPTDLNEIPGYLLSSGSYAVVVNASAEGYESSSQKKYVTVTGTKPSGPDVWIDEPLYAGRDAVFLVDTQGAEALQVNCQVMKNNTVGRKPGESVPVDGNVTEWHCSTSRNLEGYDLTASFSVKKDGRWSAWTMKTYTIGGMQPLEPAVIHVEDEIAARTEFSITVDPVEHATNYEYELYNSKGRRVWGSYYSSFIDTIQLNSVNYSAGTYTFKVWAYANDCISSVSEKTFTIASLPPLDPAVIHVEDEIAARPVFSITVDPVEYATYYECRLYNSNGGWIWDGGYYPPIEAIQFNSADYSAGAYTFEVRAYADGYINSVSEKTFTIASLPPLDPAVINVDNTIPAGKDVYITINPVENAMSYEYRLYLPNGNSWYNYDSNFVNEHYYAGYNLEPGEYTFKVWAYSDDYATSASEASFTITGTKVPGPEVSVNKNNVKSQENYMFTIDTEGVDMLYYRVGDNDAYSINVLEDETQWNTYSYYAGTYEYRFAVRRNNVWSAWSDPVVVSVTDYDPLDAPEITITSLLESGRNLTVSISEVEGATSYELSLRKKDGTVNIEWTIYPDSIEEQSFPGYRITEGAYVVCAYARNGNTYSQTTQKTITVSAGDKPQAPNVIPPENNTASGNYANFTIDTTGANKIAVRYFLVGNTNNIYYDTRTVQEGQNETTWDIYFYGTSKKYSFAVQKDDVWSEWSQFFAITSQD